MSRKQHKRRTGGMANFAIVGFFILVIAGGVGFGVASADPSDDLAQAGAFGFDQATNDATLQKRESAVSSQSSSSFDQSDLTATPTRDISSGLSMVDQKEAETARQVEIENKAAIDRVENQKAMQGIESSTDEQGAPLSSQSTEYNLPAVDWSIGKDAFIAEWTKRIDAYMENSPLEGYGKVFAQAAWDNGVDPRWSPAIANTESGKGSVCFLPRNAWGWGARSWTNWTSAIQDHVAGLADGYGYSITVDAAKMYCPPTYMDWYQVTLGQMALI